MSVILYLAIRGKYNGRNIKKKNNIYHTLSSVKCRVFPEMSMYLSILRFIFLSWAELKFVITRVGIPKDLRTAI